MKRGAGRSRRPEVGGIPPTASPPGRAARQSLAPVSLAKKNHATQARSTSQWARKNRSLAPRLLAVSRARSPNDGAGVIGARRQRSAAPRHPGIGSPDVLATVASPHRSPKRFAAGRRHHGAPRRPEHAVSPLSYEACGSQVPEPYAVTCRHMLATRRLPIQLELRGSCLGPASSFSKLVGTAKFVAILSH
jgi:hypothetical protein